MSDPPARTVWRGSDVTIGEVLGRLSRLRAEAARQEIGDQAHIHPRNSVLDVIVVASDPAEAERAAAAVEELADHHPCRAVVVLDEPGAGASRIDATVNSLVHTLVDGAACQYEQVFLRVRGQAAEHIPSLVDALLLPDVTTYLWWTGAPPVSRKRFRSTLESADVILVDSARFERPDAAFVAFAGLAAAENGTAFGDFQWARLAPWREVLAQFFNPPDRAGFLAGIGALAIEHDAGGGGNRAAAALLVGWMASVLGWRLERSTAGRDGVVRVRYESRAGRPVEVSMRPLKAKGLAPGEVSAVRLDAVDRGRDCALAAVRDAGDSGHVLVDAEVGGRKLPRLVAPVPPRADALLLSRLLVEARRDLRYPAALQAGAEVLRSARR